MVGTLKVIRESGTHAVGRKQKSKCESFVWENEWGWVNERRCGVGWDQELELEPGDVLVWTVRFKGMPNLEREPFSDTVYFDRFILWASLLPP